MRVIRVRNVNDAYNRLGHYLNEEPHYFSLYPSRNGPMLEFKTPVTTVYMKPWECVLFDKNRRCNPFFHFFEALWMLGGRNDAEFLAQFNKNIANYAEPNGLFHGAYGYRWRAYWYVDQLYKVCEELTNDPMSRRVVLQMWDAQDLFLTAKKDLPCNTSVMFRLRDRVLDMTVTNRSNDAVWGAYGANAVHFAFLHKLVADTLGVKEGAYFQVSNSLHVYSDLSVVQRMYGQTFLDPTEYKSPYETYDDVRTVPLLATTETLHEFLQDVENILENENPFAEFNTAFFAGTVGPMLHAFQAWKAKEPPRVMSAIVTGIAAPDWRINVEEYLGL